ncbi:uncharacterized protein BBA_09025 [Beauveria bassiana ARSEF 2860]|uniref:Uncharacterized protein n=1 Tax=Beauveria bassiana (strain ARSEF 2860) TaxID=655819 RepID=J4UGI2_BEAB2|nr:uncharacterized protein BBA_09025 [Beauveria bassiana ARSEF 2860]EJP61977.1 hypothetical protein BBA_09025 [Beauveria bassiana ARSEF 2860]
MDMEDFNLENFDDDYDLRTPGRDRSPSVNTPAEEPNRADTATPTKRLPLLRLNDWEADRQYDRSNPICIHYDFVWKVSLRENIRRRPITGNDQPDDLVLAPSVFWKEIFQAQLESTIASDERLPGREYTCEETIVAISIENTRGRGLKDKVSGHNIRWSVIDQHLESLAILFNAGRKITFSLEFVYKEVTDQSATGARSGKKKRKTQSEVQREKMAAESGLWNRVYKRNRCRAKYCKKGPHCLVDHQENHRKLHYKDLKAIDDHYKDDMKEGETFADVDITGPIPSHIFEQVLSRSDDSEGDPAEELNKYFTFLLTEVQSDRNRAELEAGMKFAREQCFELNSMEEHPQMVVTAMVRGNVKCGSALHMVGNIKRYRKAASIMRRRS